MFERAIKALEVEQNSSSDFDLNAGIVLPESRRLRPAGVLIALTKIDDEWSVYLTKRSSALKHHPGQIAFPGGKQDPSDADIIATALREAREEIGLPQENVRVLGQLSSHETVTSFTMKPIVALVEADFQVTPEPGEVDEVFTVPLSHVLDPKNFSVQSRRWQGRMRSYYTVPYGPNYIWGATARILRGWADATQTV